MILSPDITQIKRFNRVYYALDRKLPVTYNLVTNTLDDLFCEDIILCIREKKAISFIMITVGMYCTLSRPKLIFAIYIYIIFYLDTYMYNRSRIIFKLLDPKRITIECIIEYPEYNNMDFIIANISLILAK